MATVMETICIELKSFLLLNSKASILKGLCGFKPKGFMKLKIPNIKKKIKPEKAKIEKKMMFVRTKSFIKNIKRT